MPLKTPLSAASITGLKSFILCMAMILGSPNIAAQTQGAEASGSEAAAETSSSPKAPASPDKPALDPENILHLDLSTGGRVSIVLYDKVAPNHVTRIKTLARQGFYDGIIFHRVIDGFMAQTGDPKGNGTGGSDLPDLKAEFSRLPHLRGTVSMARAGGNNDSANSQFFIVFQPTFRIDKEYTIFGRVISGMQFVDAIKRGEPPANPDRILQASIAADNKATPDFAAARAAQTSPKPTEPEISVTTP